MAVQRFENQLEAGLSRRSLHGREEGTGPRLVRRSGWRLRALAVALQECTLWDWWLIPGLPKFRSPAGDQGMKWVRPEPRRESPVQG